MPVAKTRRRLQRTGLESFIACEIADLDRTQTSKKDPVLERFGLGTLHPNLHGSGVMSFRRILTAQTTYQQMEVWKSGSCREFRVAGAVHAWWHPSRFLTGLAWDNLAAATLLRPNGPPESLLMLGLAGGTTLRILRHLLPDCRFTAVDIDREVVDLAREHMNLDATGVDIHIADAYRWHETDTRRYDVVIDDCYLAGKEDVYRPQSQPGQDLGRLMQLLNPGGLFLTNLITGAGHRRMQSRTRTAFKRRFPNVRSVTTPDSMNETLVGGTHVLAGGALDAWTEAFSSGIDRGYWRAIEVRKLK